MEKIRIKTEDKGVADAMDFIEKNALGNPIILDAVPTKDQVKANNIAANGSDIYMRLANGKLIKLTGTEITE